MSTGSVFDVVGPNTSSMMTTEFGTVGDVTLDNLANVNTQDAVELKFDFEVQSENIEFEYIFGSE